MTHEVKHWKIPSERCFTVLLYSADSSVNNNDPAKLLQQIFYAPSPNFAIFIHQISNPLRICPTPVAVRRRLSKVRHVARVPSLESQKNRPSTWDVSFTFHFHLFFSVFVTWYRFTMVRSPFLFLSRTRTARGDQVWGRRNQIIKEKRKYSILPTCLLFAPVYDISWILGTFQEILSNNIL